MEKGRQKRRQKEVEEDLEEEGWKKKGQAEKQKK